jgi:hypothetical protein
MFRTFTLPCAICNYIAQTLLIADAENATIEELKQLMAQA